MNLSWRSLYGLLHWFSQGSAEFLQGICGPICSPCTVTFCLFFLTPKKDAVWIMGFVRIASFVSYRNFLFWPIRMKYDLSFCQDACLGIQQISKHTFVNSINEMMCLTYKVLLLLLYQAQQLYHIPSLHLAVCPVPTVVLRTMINETYCICITSLKMHVGTDMFNKVQIH